MATTAPSGVGRSGSTLDTGLDKQDRSAVASDLMQVLAGTYTLMVKTHVYHWNVVGPLFIPFHELTEDHYKDLFEAVDLIAERIRALGHRAPLSFAELLPKSVVEEETTNRSAEDMVAHLIADHEQLVKRLREAGIAADEVDDLVTTDMLTDRLAFHEKAIWMLRAIVGEA